METTSSINILYILLALSQRIEQDGCDDEFRKDVHRAVIDQMAVVANDPANGGAFMLPDSLASTFFSILAAQPNTEITGDNGTTH